MGHIIFFTKQPKLINQLFYKRYLTFSLKKILENVCFYTPQSTCTPPSSRRAWPGHVPSTQITPRERRRHISTSHPQLG